MATLSSSFFPPSNRRRCVKSRPSYAENSDNFLNSIPPTKEEAPDDFNENDLLSVEQEQDDADEEPITIDLSAFLNENPLLAQAAFESSVENNVASSESSSQFRVTDCEVKPSEIPVEIPKPDFDQTPNTANVGNDSPSLFLDNALVSDSHDSVKENCLSTEPDVTTIPAPVESPVKMTLNSRVSPVKKFNRARPLGLSNPLKKYKNFMKIKDLNKTNLNVFGKYPVVKCEKLDIDTLVKSSKLKINNWSPGPVKNTFKTTLVAPKRSILAKGPMKPGGRKPISFSKYLVNPTEKPLLKPHGLFKSPLGSILNPVVIKNDNWKAEISQNHTVRKLFKSPFRDQSIVYQPSSVILNEDNANEPLNQSVHACKLPLPRLPCKRNSPIITNVQNVANSSKTFKLIAPKPFRGMPESVTVVPTLPKPEMEVVSSDFTVIEPYVEDPTSPIKPKPLITVPIEVLSSPEKRTAVGNNVIGDVSNKKNSPKTFSSVFLSRGSDISRDSTKFRKVITVNKKQLLRKKQFGFQKLNKMDKFGSIENSMIQPLDDGQSVFKAKRFVVDAMQSAFKACSKTKRSKPKLKKIVSPLSPLPPADANAVSYSKTFNDLFFGFSDNDFEEVSISTEDELSSQASIPSIKDEPTESSFKMPPSEPADACALKAINNFRPKKSGPRKKFSIESPYSSDTLSASECENEPASKFKRVPKAKRQITSTPKAIVSSSAPKQKSKTSPSSNVENFSISDSLSEDVNSSQNNKTFDNSVPDSFPSLSNLKQSTETPNVSSPSKTQAHDPSNDDNLDTAVIDIETVHNVKDKGKDNTTKQETSSRTLRNRKCSSVEVENPSVISTKLSVLHQDSSEKPHKLVKGQVENKLKIQMKTPPRSTAKVKIKQKKAKPDDILQEINTITGGKLKLKKCLKNQKPSSKSSDLSNDSGNASPKSSSKPLNVPKKTKSIKVPIKHSFRQKKLSPKMSLKSSSSEKLTSKSSLSENNDSLHSTFRGKMAGEKDSVCEENGEAVVDIDVESVVVGVETSGGTVDKDLQVNSSDNSVDQTCVNDRILSSESAAGGELFPKHSEQGLDVLTHDVSSTENDGDVNELLKDTEESKTGDSLSNSALEKQENECESFVENGDNTSSSESAANDASNKEVHKAKDNVVFVDQEDTTTSEESKVVSFNQGIEDVVEEVVVTSQSNGESCNTVIESEISQPTPDSSRSSVICDEDASPSKNTIHSEIVSALYDEVSTSCDSNNTEISPVEEHKVISKPSTESSETLTDVPKSMPVPDLIDLFEESTDAEDVISSDTKADASAEVQVIPLTDACISKEIGDSAKVSEGHSQESTEDIMTKDMSDPGTPKQSLKLKLSFKNAKTNSPDKSWVVSDGETSATEGKGDSAPRQNASSESGATDLHTVSPLKEKISQNPAPADSTVMQQPIKIKQEPVDFTDDNGLSVPLVQDASKPKPKKRPRGRSSKHESNELPAKKPKAAGNAETPAKDLLVPKTEAMEEETADSSASIVSPKSKGMECTKLSPKGTPKPGGGKKSISIPSSKSTSQRRKNYDSKLVLVPFTIGWMREHVIRASTEKRASDVYYFAADGTKLRSIPEILTYLSKHPEIKLGKENFTFAKELIFREPFERERSALAKYAALTPAKRQSSSLAGSSKKRPSIQGKNNLSPKTDLDSPLSSSPSKKRKRSNGPDSSVSVKQEICSDDENAPSTSKKQTTLEKFFAKTPDGSKTKQSKLLKSKEARPLADICREAGGEKTPNRSPKKGKKIPENNIVLFSSSPDLGSDRTKKIQKGLKVKLARRVGVKYTTILQRPCTRFCNFSFLRVPSVKCSVCLCLFHPECISFARPSALYACNPCAANASIFSTDPCPDDPSVPFDIDLNLLQAESSFQIYRDPVFDEIFNKFQSPVDHSFNYVQTPPAPRGSGPNVHRFYPPVPKPLSSTVAQRVNPSTTHSGITWHPPQWPNSSAFPQAKVIGSSTSPVLRLSNPSSVSSLMSKGPALVYSTAEGACSSTRPGVRVLKITSEQARHLFQAKNSVSAQQSPSVLQTLLQSDGSPGTSSILKSDLPARSVFMSNPSFVDYSKKHRLPASTLPNVCQPSAVVTSSNFNSRKLEVRVGNQSNIVTVISPTVSTTPVATSMPSLVYVGPPDNLAVFPASGSTLTENVRETIDQNKSASEDSKNVEEASLKLQEPDPKSPSTKTPESIEASKNAVEMPPKKAENSSKVNECLHLVFKYLNVCDLLRVSQVCHYWRKLATQKYLWEHVRFSDLRITDWSKCLKTLQKHQTKSIDMRGILGQDSTESWDIFSSYVNIINKVERLVFEKVPPFVVKQIGESIPQLKSLTCYCLATVFTEPEIWSTPCMFELHSLVGFSQLRKLKLSSMGGITLDDSYLSLLPFLPQLTHLVLTGFKFHTYVNLVCLAQLTQLVSLELGDCYDIEPQIYSLFDDLKGLKSLCLQNGGKLDDMKLGDSILKLPKLENLELLNYQISKYLSKVLKKKESLSFLSVWPDNNSQAAIVNFNALSAVRACTTLKAVCWGILTDSDDDVPNVLELRDPSKPEEDSYSMTFEELFRKLTSHFPGKVVELKCLPRSIWSEFCSSRDFC